MENRGRVGKRGRAAVVVLGDLGRSPRMQYHALSLARQVIPALLEVDVVAYEGTDPHGAVLQNPSIHLHRMKPIVAKGFPRLLYLLVLPIKALVQFLTMLWLLCVRIPPPDVFIVQCFLIKDVDLNSPGWERPKLELKNARHLEHFAQVCHYASAMHYIYGEARPAIYFSNKIGSVIGDGKDNNPPSVPSLIAVSFASWWRRVEKCYGIKADGSLCVTKAMQHELAQNWGIRATVLYDQPPEFFRPASLRERHEVSWLFENYIFVTFMIVLALVMLVVNCSDGRDSSAAFQRGELKANDTLFTTLFEDNVFLKPNRPALIVSSTSWTADEDFGILLEAAVMYDRRVAAILNEDDSVEEENFWMDICNGKKYLYPRLLFIITGKGPEREKYEKQIKKLHLKRVAFRTMWLAAEDYPLLLGSADLGVCLHTSSSGLDLPMKVVDIIEELVKVKKNGLLFSSSSELADELLMLFKGFPDQCDSLKSLRDGALVTSSTSRWATEWEEHALPLVDEASNLPKLPRIPGVDYSLFKAQIIAYLIHR
ncbi:hypothetical protein ACLOJK_036003 [Asimina triloba]